MDASQLGTRGLARRHCLMACSSPCRWRWRRFPIGLPIGFFIALAKQSASPRCALAGNIYTTIFRGLPELVTLFLVYFGAQIVLQSLVQFVDPDATIDVNSFVAGMIALGVVFSSYASEVFLSAFRAIPNGQYEGGYAIGLTKGQTMRLVVLPQLIRIALSGPGQFWLILLKDTALVSVVGLAGHLRKPASPRASPSMPSCSTASRPGLPRAGHHLLVRHPCHRALARQPGGTSMSVVTDDRINVERPPPHRTRLAARAHRRLCASRALDRLRHRPRRLSGALPGTPEFFAKYAPAYLSRPGRHPGAGRHLDRASAPSFRCRSPMRACRRTAPVRPRLCYVYFFRGTPLLVQTFLVYYGLGSFRPELEAVGLWSFFREAFYCGDLRLLAEHRRLPGRNPARRHRERAQGPVGRRCLAWPAQVADACARSSCRRR